MNIKLSIITPVLNGEKYIEKCIKSIVNQNYKNIEYIIVDGKSTDRTLSIIKKYRSKISNLIIGKDASMYEALKKGFNKASGNYFCWINSDDYLIDNFSVERLITIIKKYKYEWFNCKVSVSRYNKKPNIYFPLYYPRYILKNGYAHNCFWGFVQQENTIFSKKLYKKVNGINPNYKMAGDYDLWKKFAKYEKLNSANIVFACHRKSENQLTDLKKYYQEIKKRKCLVNFFYPLRIIISLLLLPFLPKYHD